MNRIDRARLSMAFAMTLALQFASHTEALMCPFELFAPTPASMARDGLALLRIAQNVSDAALTAALTPGSATANALRDKVNASAAFDVDCSGNFDSNDAVIVARHLSGYRSDKLVADLALTGKRHNAYLVQRFLDAGCPVPQNANGPSYPTATCTVATPSTDNLKTIAEASLAANIRKAHPHEGNSTQNPGVPATTSPYVSPGNAFTQGIPGDDVEQTALYSVGAITGEVGGFDIFNAVNPADTKPGNGLVTAFYASVNGARRDAPGDRFLLGDHKTAYFLGRVSDVDNDFARMMQVDTRVGNEIVLYGAPTDYFMVQTSGLESGTAIFYNDHGTWDMVGYIDLLIKTDPTDAIYKYVRFANAPSLAPSLPLQWDQFGGAGADLITGLDVDPEGNVYVVGFSRSDLSNLFPFTSGTGQMFAAKYSSAGQRVWLTRFGSFDGIGDLAWDIAVDATHSYIAARYIAPESRRNGQKDSAYFKVANETGVVAASALWEDVGVQFAGAVVLDNADFVYFSGIGFDRAQPNPDGSQDPYIEKRRRSDLSLVSRKMFGGDINNVPGAGGAENKEPWGGLAFQPKPGGLPGEGMIYSAGWTGGSYEGTTARGGGDAFLVAFNENLEIQWFEGWGSNQRDWVWDMALDSSGHIYVVGMTLGAMAGQGSAMGQGDGFITKFDPNAPAGSRLIWTKQFGTDKSDEFRRIKIVNDELYVAGHTYGSIDGFQNAGESDLWIAKLDTSGNVLSQIQIGSAEVDRTHLAVSSAGVFLGGYSFGSLVKSTQGFIDATLLRLNRALQ
jgi:Beta-propeller repeat